MKNENLKKARLEKCLTQEQLAALLGYKGKQTIANWENGYAYPTLHKALQTADLLSKSVSYLFGQACQMNRNEKSQSANA